jgi:hypothetical protein
MSKSHRRHGRTTLAIVFGETGEPIAVLCDPEGDPPGLRWFTVVLDDTPGPDGPSQAPVCVDCFLDEHPLLDGGWTSRSSIVVPSGVTVTGFQHRSSGTRERACSRCSGGRARRAGRQSEVPHHASYLRCPLAAHAQPFTLLLGSSRRWGSDPSEVLVLDFQRARPARSPAFRPLWP